jgi:SAM-dependent methyltransferase
MSKERITIRQWKDWWDERAASEHSADDLVVGSKHRIEQATTTFLFNRILAYLQSSPGRGTVLDAGCGVGLYFPLLSPFEKIIGLDLSMGVLMRMPRELRENPSILPLAASLTEIPLQDGSVDAILCRGMLHYLPDEAVPKVFMEYRRVLVPGGVAVVEFKNSHHFMHRVSVLKRRLLFRPEPSLMPEKLSAGHDIYRPWGWYVDLCQRAGFRVEHQFSWQLFFWGRLRKYGLARSVERLERWLRRTGLERFIRHDGISHYLLLRKSTGSCQ